MANDPPPQPPADSARAETNQDTSTGNDAKDLTDAISTAAMVTNFSIQSIVKYMKDVHNVTKYDSISKVRKRMIRITD